MPYDFHIERMAEGSDSKPTPMALEEWRTAIAAIEGVRLFTAGAQTVTSPKKGQVLGIRKREGDAEVFFREEREWYSVFRWRNGSAVFAAKCVPGDSSHPVWVAAVALASRLGAVIRGDKGEVYDLQTGQVCTDHAHMNAQCRTRSAE